MAVQPALRDATKSLGPTREVHDRVGLRSVHEKVPPPVEERVCLGCSEEPAPVLASPGQVMQPVADVGEHPVDVEDGERLIAHGSFARVTNSYPTDWSTGMSSSSAATVAERSPPPS